MLNHTAPSLAFNHHTTLTVPVQHHRSCNSICRSTITTAKHSPYEGIQTNTPQPTPKAVTIETNLRLTGQSCNNNHSQLPLNFKPSLNYLTVIGGGTNAKNRDSFNEFEFQSNTINHAWWLINAEDELYQHYGLSEDLRHEFEQLFHKLLKCHMTDQLFNTVSGKQRGNTKGVAKVLLSELKSSGRLLLHANDTSHAFYIEITKSKSTTDTNNPGSSNPTSNLFDIHIYNTGKGLSNHIKRTVTDPTTGKKKIKFYTKKPFSILLYPVKN